jgi:hypothetical protein
MRSGIGTVSTPKRTYYNQPLFPRRALVLLLCVVAGAAAALLLMPRIVRAAGDDTSRLCTILDELHSRPAPRLAVLGNSVGMLGIDARQLGGWNLCSPAQTLAEGFLLRQELPASTVVVQLVTPWQLATNIAVDRDHYNAMRLCGYTPRAETRDVIARVFNADIAPRALAERVYGRRHLRAAIEGLARRNGGGWPAEDRFAALAGGEFRVHESQLRILQWSGGRSGRRFLVVLAPVHPRLQKNAAPCPKGLDCIDLTRLLDASEFRDATHANAAGAARLTRAIRDALTARRLLSVRLK